MRKLLIAASAAAIIAMTFGHPAVAEPSREDIDKALESCPANTDQGSDGVCYPKKAGRMGFDYALPDDTAAPSARKPGAASRASLDKATGHKPAMPAMPDKAMAMMPPPATVDLQMTFAKSSWVLTERDKDNARVVARALQETRNANKHLAIEGHTDSRGNAASNLELSRKRAEAVKNYLVSLGIDASRLKAEGLGSTQPIDADHPESPENRRVVVHRI